MALAKGTKLRVGDKVFVEGMVLGVANELMPNEIKLPYNTKVFLSNDSEQLYTSLKKPIVTQAVMDYYNNNQAFQDYEDWFDLQYMIENDYDTVSFWLYGGDKRTNLKNQHAFGTLITYGPEAVDIVG